MDSINKVIAEIDEVLIFCDDRADVVDCEDGVKPNDFMRLESTLEGIKNRLQALSAAQGKDADELRRKHETAMRVIGGQYMFCKERYGVQNILTYTLSRLIDDIEKAIAKETGNG